MKKFNPENQRWMLLSALLVVLGFNLSIHNFEKDEHGFAVIKEFKSDPILKNSPNSGVFEFASTACDNDSKSEECKKEKKEEKEKIAADIKSKKDKLSEIEKDLKEAQEKKEAAAKDPDMDSSDLRIVRDNVNKLEADKKEVEQAIKNLQEKDKKIKFQESAKNTVASISYHDTACKCTKTVDLTEEVLNNLLKVLNANGKAQDSAKDAKGDSAKVADKDKPADDDEDDSKAELERKRRSELAEKKKSFREKTFAGVMDECSAESEKTNEIYCRAEKMLSVIKDNADRIKERKAITGATDKDIKLKEKMDVKILSDKDFTEFYVKNIKSDMIEFLNPSLEGQRGKELTMGVKIAKYLEAELPKSMESLRADVIATTMRVIENSGALAQQTKIQENQYVAQQTRVNPNFANEKFMDPVYNSLMEQGLKQQQLTQNMSSAFAQMNREGLSAAYSKGNVDLMLANQYMSRYMQRTLRIQNGIMNPLDSRYQLVTLDNSGNMDLFSNSNLGIFDSTPMQVQQARNIMGGDYNNAMISRTGGRVLTVRTGMPTTNINGNMQVGNNGITVLQPAGSMGQPSIGGTNIFQAQSNIPNANFMTTTTNGMMPQNQFPSTNGNFNGQTLTNMNYSNVNNGQFVPGNNINRNGTMAPYQGQNFNGNGAVNRRAANPAALGL